MFYRFLPPLFFFFLLHSCSRSSQKAEPRRIAVLPFHNLTDDPGLDWEANALAGILASSAAGDSPFKIFDVASEREALLRQANETIEGTFQIYDGKLIVSGVLRVNSKNVKVLSAATIGNQPIEAAKKLASEIAERTEPFTTSVDDAVKQFYMASNASGFEEVLRDATAASVADPHFGKAHLLRAESLLRLNRPAEARQALQAAAEARMTALDTARLRLLRAETVNLPGERASATEQLAALTADVQLWLSLAQQRFVSKDLPAAARALEQAALLTPRDVTVWNQLAYARGYAGDIAGAEKAIQQYRTIAPNDANAIDSLGEIYFAARRFREAEATFLKATEQDKTLLGGADYYRAGLSAYLAGDLRAADRHMADFAAFREKGKDPILPLRNAIWLQQTGRAAEGAEALRKLAQSGGQLGGLASAQLAVTEAAAGRPIAPTNLGNSNPRLEAWSLLLNKQYAGAFAAWKKIYDGDSAISDGESRVALAWAMSASDGQDWKPLLVRPPSPPAAPDPGLGSLLLPKWQELHR